MPYVCTSRHLGPFHLRGVDTATEKPTRAIAEHWADDSVGPESTPTQPPPCTSASPVFTPVGDASGLAAGTGGGPRTLFDDSSDDYDVAIDDGVGVGLDLDAAEAATRNRTKRMTALHGGDTHDVELLPVDEPLLPTKQPMTVETTLQLTASSSTLKSNTIVTTHKPTSYLRPYGRPPDGPMGRRRTPTHTAPSGSLVLSHSLAC
jgi:hypothetical protein